MKCGSGVLRIEIRESWKGKIVVRDIITDLQTGLVSKS